MKYYKKLYKNFVLKFQTLLIKKIVMKDAEDNEGRYVKIQGKAWSVLFQDLDFAYQITSEPLQGEYDIALFSNSVRYSDSRIRNEISSTKKNEIVKKVRELLLVSGVKVLVMQ